ncbi:MAG: STAS domain-containing protein [Candidatus Sumerlaeaceae bacterium]|nr:STAS domain-containing protein [Candidatus Sumerlaeaceae bacterium]
MDSSKRQSRADRRHQTNPDIEEERRRTNPRTEFHALSVVSPQAFMIFVQDILAADNISLARESLMQHLGRSKAPTVILDMGQVPFVDTIGLGLLVEIKKSVTVQGREFVIQNPSRALLRILNITGMSRIFNMRVVKGSDVDAIPKATPLPPDIKAEI